MTSSSLGSPRRRRHAMLRVPADAVVEVTSVHVVGGRSPLPPAAPAERTPPVVRLRSYGIFGGVSVRRD